MARAKRFYLCNLIPLCEIDDEHLEVDWSREHAIVGEAVEMRVAVKDLDLKVAPPNFSLRFDVYESDYLLFGGLNDWMGAISSKAEEDAEQRAIAALGEAEAIPAADRLKKIFVSPAESGKTFLMRAYWQAVWQDDVAGEPEYYFDVRLVMGDKTMEERADHELVVSQGVLPTGDGTVVGAKAGVVLPAVGWSQKEAFADDPLELVVLLREDQKDKPVRFSIKPDEDAGLFWVLFIAKSVDVPAQGKILLRSPWKIPVMLPLEGVRKLHLKGEIAGQEVNAVDVPVDGVHQVVKDPALNLALNAELTVHPGRAKSEPKPPNVSEDEQRQGAAATLKSDQALQTLQPATEAEYNQWAQKEKKAQSSNDERYAYDVQEYVNGLVIDPHTHTPKPRPSGGQPLARWQESFRKAYVLALMILSSTPKVQDKEARAAIIAGALSQAGFVTESMRLAALFTSRDNREILYKDVLKQVNKASVSELQTVVQFFTEGTGVFAESELQEACGFLQGSITVEGETHTRLLPTTTRSFIASLGNNDVQRNEKLDVIAQVLITAYANDPDVVLALAGFLFFATPYRRPFAEKLWHDGKGYLLYKILSTLEFTEPEYGNPTLDQKTLTMQQDMPWVYENKQRFLADFLVFLGERAASPMPRPASLSFQNVRAWLEAQTEAIAKAAVQVYPGENQRWRELYSVITDAFFFHVDRGDVQPDLSGHIGTLLPSDPNKLRLRADCDVFATYGTRFLRAAGFISIGYMGVWKNVGRPDEIGHAGALLKFAEHFYLVSNKQASRLTAASEADALRQMRDELLDVLSKPTAFIVHYAPAESNGAMSQKILDRTADTRREDLE